jgi:hypothetical protein
MVVDGQASALSTFGRSVTTSGLICLGSPQVPSDSVIATKAAMLS